MVVALLFISVNRSVVVFGQSFCHKAAFRKCQKIYHPHPLQVHFSTPGFHCPSASHSSSQIISSPSLKPSHREHHGFIYTGLVFLPSAHHIGSKVWKRTEQSRACPSPPANMKPILAPSRQPLHQQLVSNLWRLKPANDLLVSEKEFKQSWDYTKSWKRAYWKRRRKKKRPHQLHVW